MVCGVGSGERSAGQIWPDILSDPCATVIVVEQRGRVARFGVGQVAAALDRRVVVADPGETAGDAMRDVTRVLTGMCARRFWRGGVRNRALCAVGATGNAGSGLAA